MINMNIDESKNGFTLIELIAVVAIIMIVAVSTIISYSKILNRQEISEYNIMEDNIKAAGRTYLSITNLSCSNYILSLYKLRTNGLISAKLVNSKTNKELDYINSYLKISCSSGKYSYELILKDKE